MWKEANYMVQGFPRADTTYSGCHGSPCCLEPTSLSLYLWKPTIDSYPEPDQSSSHIHYLLFL